MCWLLSGALFLWGLPALGGTTGSVRGRVVDAATGKSVAGATVTASSPSQRASTASDATGQFGFLSLAPDTYVLSVRARGYAPASAAGITVFADQAVTYTLTLQTALKTIAKVSSTSASTLVRAGTSSNVYSVSPSVQQASNAIAGSGSLNTAYSALSTAPGVTVPQGQQGWNQGVYVRGGDVYDVEAELDGVPITTPNTGGIATSLSSLGQQEVQVYTGGVPSSDSSGLAGFINQIVKTGTYPGFATVNGSIGSPSFYHQVAVEAGGATPDRSFSYYVGIEGADQAYRFGDQFNAPANPLFFWPINVPTSNGFNYDGDKVISTPYGKFDDRFTYAPGASNSPSFNANRQNVFNFHVAVPHRNDGLRDDLQMLYETGEIFGNAYDTQIDLGYPSLAIPYLQSSHNPYEDSVIYTGRMYAPGNPSYLQAYYQPSSPENRPPGSAIPYNVGDNTDNGWSVSKLQYQRNFNESSYLRALAYTQFTNYFINGPVSASMVYGAWPQDYEASTHVWGGKLSYANQLDSHNLLNASVAVDTQRIVTANFTTFDPVTTGGMAFDYVDKRGECHDPSNGQFVSCFAGSPAFYQPFVPNSVAGVAASFPGPGKYTGAQWLVTENGQYGQIDTVSPTWTTASLGDHLQPSDRWVLDLGVRWEDFAYQLPSTTGSTARAFWFAAWNRENCFVPGSTSILTLTIDPVTGAPLGPTGKPFDCAKAGGVPLVNTTPGNASYYAFEPRFAVTYTIDPDTVLRGSAGRYAESPGSTGQEFDFVQQNLASRLAQFLPYGYNTPYHDERPEYSSNFDLSLEKHLKGTDYSYKITPYYRQTYDQLQLTPVGPQGIFAAFNTDSQTNYGLEFLFRKGDFARNGLSVQLGYTLNESRVRYNNLGTSTQNAIDLQNAYVQQYNSYTGHCGSGTGPNSLCGIYGTQFSRPSFPAADGKLVANPYFGLPAQPLFDRNGWYSPYDVIPSPFSGASGYNVPTNLSLILNYKRDKWTVTPTATFAAGQKYGSPLTWPGYDPATCLAIPVPGKSVPCGQLLVPDAYTGKFDAQGAFVDPSRFTLNVQAAYQASPRVTLTAVALGIVDACNQRGYPWDNAQACQYGQLASNHLAPAGNFMPSLAATPPQLRYPYGVFGNPTNNGYIAAKMPFTAVFSAQVKL
ncbi:MAG: TonB-dependent receptor [Candidatus Eremiobacteraeota bacterium]|nr:TonB-dependent receptor [Candidatus Eremiobacteraeota bacterium]